MTRVTPEQLARWKKTGEPPVPSLVAEVERLREALRRLGSCEAFKGARALDQDRDEELLARIDFARAALEDGT